MKDGLFVFDSAVHLFDLQESNTRTAVGAMTNEVIQVMSNLMSVPEKMPPNPSLAGHRPDIEQCTRWLFEESDTDMAVVQTVPLLEYWNKGVAPPDLQAEFARANPDRVIFCGGVDPLYQGVQGALDEMERQVGELGARSFKFYQTQSRGMKWRADDERVAYPLYEKALELGVNYVQFHKGVPFGDQSLDDLHSTDLQYVALDFPGLTIGVHHLGDPFVEETIAVAAQVPNIVMVLPVWFNQYLLQPRRMLHRLGQCLFSLGPDRLLYGSEAFVWPKPQGLIDAFYDLEMPDDLQEGYGYPPLDRVTKAKILGLNQARILGIEVPSAESAVAR